MNFIVGQQHQNFRIGFIPGEKISYNIDISNQSRRSLKKSILQLAYKITFNIRGRKRHEKNVIAMHCSPDGIGPGDSGLWQGEMEIPIQHGFSRLPSTNLAGNINAIQIEYFLKLKVLPKNACPLKLSLPIIMGTVTNNSNFDTTEIAPSAPYTDLTPPPTYDQIFAT